MMLLWKHWQRRRRAAATRCPPDWSLRRDDRIILFRYVLLWCSLHLRSEGGRRQQTFIFTTFHFFTFIRSLHVMKERKKNGEKLHFDSRRQHRLISIIEQPSVKVSALEVELLVLLVEDAALWGEVSEQWEKRNITFISQVIQHFTNYANVTKEFLHSQTLSFSQYLNSLKNFRVKVRAVIFWLQIMSHTKNVGKKYLFTN